ncbi:MAG TPA: CDP-glycerol glycerophosphotransferase family protein [Gaiellaceae bacterium]|nr:CDP-glycerol glycerophosphotransferase family protein [Gaiellaceae bacterium]
MAQRRTWLVFPDPLTTRLFVETRLLARLAERLGDRLQVVFLEPRAKASSWADTEGLQVAYYDDLFPERVPPAERVFRRLDAMLERRLGFWPLAIRFNNRYGFHVERMAHGHGNPFLDLDHADPLPRWGWIERAMLGWYFSPRRYVPSALLDAMRGDCALAVVANMQTPAVAPVLNGARRLGIPTVGYVASWDHAVGKGVISSRIGWYVVQNDVMRYDLRTYHGVDPARVIITGWPQSDYFHERRPREEFEALARRHGLDPGRPVVLVMGNTPTNTPYEPLFFERLLDWWEASGARNRFSLLFRPHPRDRRWEERFAIAMGREGAAVERADEADIVSLAVMLEHGACVVSNAGTILLDALVNDRPAVCVLYDEGAPAGENWAAKNVLGVHYRELMSSTAFYRATSFDEVTAAIERALEHPGELSGERRRVAREVVGELDGQAGERVVDAIVARAEKA